MRMHYSCSNFAHHEHRWNWLAQLCGWRQWLFCKHVSARFIRMIYGDEINMTGHREMWGCDDCKRILYRVKV